MSSPTLLQHFLERAAQTGPERPFLVHEEERVSYGAAEARSGNHQHARIANCSDHRMLVCTFNGKDADTNNEHDFERLPSGNKARLSCHGDGVGGCKIKAANNPNSSCGDRTRGKLWSGRL